MNFCQCRMQLCAALQKWAWVCEQNFAPRSPHPIRFREIALLLKNGGCGVERDLVPVFPPLAPVGFEVVASFAASCHQVSAAANAASCQLPTSSSLASSSSLSSSSSSSFHCNLHFERSARIRKKISGSVRWMIVFLQRCL